MCASVSPYKVIYDSLTWYVKQEQKNTKQNNLKKRRKKKTEKYEKKNILSDYLNLLIFRLLSICECDICVYLRVKKAKQKNKWINLHPRLSFCLNPNGASDGSVDGMCERGIDQNFRFHTDFFFYGALLMSFFSPSSTLFVFKGERGRRKGKSRVNCHISLCLTEDWIRRMQKWI